MDLQISRIYINFYIFFTNIPKKILTYKCKVCIIRVSKVIKSWWNNKMYFVKG